MMVQPACAGWEAAKFISGDRKGAPIPPKIWNVTKLTKHLIDETLYSLKMSQTCGCIPSKPSFLTGVCYELGWVDHQKTTYLGQPELAMARSGGCTGSTLSWAFDREAKPPFEDTFRKIWKMSWLCACHDPKFEIPWTWAFRLGISRCSFFFGRFGGSPRTCSQAVPMTTGVSLWMDSLLVQQQSWWRR